MSISVQSPNTRFMSRKMTPFIFFYQLTFLSVFVSPFEFLREGYLFSLPVSPSNGNASYLFVPVQSLFWLYRKVSENTVKKYARLVEELQSHLPDDKKSDTDMLCQQIRTIRKTEKYSPKTERGGQYTD